MPRSVVILFLIVLHLKPARNVAIYLDYVINFDYIKNVLCINKERPKLKCNGKCYLMQRLDKNQPDKNRAPFPRTEITKIEYVDFSNLKPNEVGLTIESIKKPFPIYLSRRYRQLSKDIFHPPRA